MSHRRNLPALGTLLLLGSTLVFLLPAPLKATADALIVTTAADSGTGSLRQTIADADPGDEIVFDGSLSGQTIVLSSEISITKDLAVNGAGLTLPIRISGNGAVRVLNIGSSSSVSVSHVAIVSGLTMTGGIGCPAHCGGGILLQSGASLTLTDSLIADNAAGFRGGGIYSDGTLSVISSTIVDNSAYRQGGGLFSTGTVSLHGSEVSRNTASLSSGGGIQNHGNLTISNSALQSNTSGGLGGGINNTLGLATVTHSTLSANQAVEGGAMSSHSSTVVVQNSSVYGNSAGSGGGLYNNLSVITVTHSTLSGNLATASIGLGGGIRNYGTLTVVNSTLSGNSAYEGGGVNHQNGALVIVNSTLAGNTASNQGGGITSLGELSLRQVIIADSQGGDCANHGTIGQNQHTLVEDNSCQPSLHGDPLLAPLADNGGPTLTHALAAASPAVDVADPALCPAQDQRGMPRPQGAACDLGAYEFGTITTYSISGRVVDPSGAGVGQVTITAGTHLTTTDASGNYTLTGLAAGNYSVTPGKAGYSFAPPYRAAPLPQSRTGIDFEARLDPVTSELPLVFVHGWSALEFPWVGLFSGIGCFGDYRNQRLSENEADAYFGPLDQLLDQTRDVFYARLVSNRCFTPRLGDNVPYLMEAIQQAKSETGQPQVILIAHSMGGLVSRVYLENRTPGVYRDDVAALFTLGTPHHGIPLDVLVFTVNGGTVIGDAIVDWGTFCEDRQPAMCDFSIVGMVDFNQHHSLRSGVDYYFLAGDPPTWARNPLGLATDALFLSAPNDGLVELSSGLGTWLTNSNHVHRYANDENHNYFGTSALYDWPYFGPRWNLFSAAESKVYTECLKPVLVDDQPDACASTAQMVEVAVGETPLARTPLAGGTLLAGQIATRTVAVDGGQVLFVGLWPTGTLALTLVAPGGLVIDPVYAAANPTVVSYTASAEGAAYALPDAQAGSWQLVTQALSTPPAGAPYATLGAFASSLRLDAGTDQRWYTPGATATLTATLSGAPLSAAITATVSAGGTATIIPQLLSGGGDYQGTFQAPNAPGYAQVQFAATGNNGTGLPFERETGVLFQISPQSFSLNGSYGETPHPYPTLPAQYQALTVTVGVNTAVSGTLALSADLVDGTGAFVAHALTTRAVTTGTVTIALAYEGSDIYAAQRDGPYTLTNLLLTDQTGVTLVTAEAVDAYGTAPYTYAQFAPLRRLWLPLLER